jgi:hypothetical protein
MGAEIVPRAQGKGTVMKNPFLQGTRVTSANQSRWVLILAVLFSVLYFHPLIAYSAGDLTLFSTEEKAQQHCPKDIVVWLNLPSGIYHFKGERWYGNTKNGAFVCEQEAEKAGDRATRNGQ